MKSIIASAATESAPTTEFYAEDALFGPWEGMLHRLIPTLRYLARTEVHTFAFSVAANAILSFFPFVLLLTWLVRNVFHSHAMFQVIVDLLKNQLPAGQDFVVRNVTVLADARHSARIVSGVILLISSSGVFLPLEVAFNRIWGFPKNRSYLGNQLISLVLALSCGLLGLLSVGLAAGNKVLLASLLGGYENIVVKTVTFAVLKVFAMAATVSIFFLIYWVLPHGKVRARAVLPAAIVIGLVWEAAKYVYILTLPWLNFHEVYGPFTIAITLMVWAFISGMLVLAGAHLAATPETESAQPATEPTMPVA